MKHLVLSLEDVRRDCLELSEHLNQKNIKPEFIIYIKTGGIIVAKEFATIYNAKYAGIRIKRSLTNAKGKVRIVLNLLPSFIKAFLRELEIRVRFLKNEEKRFVSQCDELDLSAKNILLIDDSADSGYSIKTALEFLNKEYKNNAEFTIIVLNKFNKSDNLVNINFYKYSNCIITYPWSNDSKQYQEFRRILEDEKS